MVDSLHRLYGIAEKVSNKPIETAAAYRRKAVVLHSRRSPKRR